MLKALPFDSKAIDLIFLLFVLSEVLGNQPANNIGSDSKSQNDLRDAVSRRRILIWTCIYGNRSSWISPLSTNVPRANEQYGYIPPTLG